MKKFVAVVLALALAGCSTAQQAKFQTGLTNVNNWANKYGPVIGKDIIMVANILVQAECSPALGAATSTVSNVLLITAPNSSSAQTVGNVLATNYAVAQQLCPLISTIKTSVGNVPNIAPSQTVPVGG